MKSEHSAYIELSVRITILNKGRRSRGGNEERKEGRKESVEKGHTTSQPFRGDRAGSMERGLRVLEDRIRPSTYIHYPPARAYKNPRGLSTSGPSDARCSPGALSSLRGNLGSFYERSLWKRASCARDKPAVPTYAECVHIHSHESIRGIHTHTHTYALESSTSYRYTNEKHTSASNALQTYIYIYIYIYRERERERGFANRYTHENHTYTYKIASYNYKGILHRVCMCV